MIGDAPGDLAAARSNAALFFPINPGHEEQSWERFYREGIDRFFDHAYAGDYEASLIEEFESCSPKSRRGKAGARAGDWGLGKDSRQ